MTSPASLSAILASDAGSGNAFGVLLALLPLAGGLALTSATVADPVALVAGWLLGALAFVTLGVLLAAPATDTPSRVMMLSNLVRLPLIFITGVFVPHDQMPAQGQWLSPPSPLSYCADPMRVSFGAKPHWSVAADSAALLGFTLAYGWLALLLHRRTPRQ